MEGQNGNLKSKEAGNYQRFGTTKQRANTAVIYYCNLALGVTMAFLAPALIEFTKKFDTDMKTMSIVMSVGRAIGLFSSLGFGFLFGHVNRHAVVTLMVFIMSAMIFSMPYAANLIVFASLLTIMGVGAAGYGTAQAVWVIDIWKDKAGPWIQGQHFFFALGSIIPPTLFAPFLENSPASHEPNPTFNATDDELGESTTPTESSRILIPTFICAGIVGIGGFLLLSTLIAFRSRQRRKQIPSPAERESLTTESSEDDNGNQSESSGLCKKVTLIALSAVFTGSFMAMEGTIYQFLPAYAHYSEFHLSEADGARVLSAFSIAFTLARLAGVFVILKLDPKIMLLINIITVAVANVLLLVSTASTSIWIGSVLLGSGLATSVPTIFAFIRAHLNITNVVGSIMLVGGGVAAACYPVLVGIYIETFANIIPVLNLISVSVGACAFLAIILIVRKK